MNATTTMTILTTLLLLTPVAFGCINNTDIQQIADATGTPYILWDNIFNYYCDGMDDMAGQIDDNNATLHGLRNGTNETIYTYLKLNNMTEEHYLKLNNLTLAGYQNMYNLSLNHHINVTGNRIDAINRSVHDMTNLTTYLHNLTLLQSEDILEEYREISDAADLEIVNQVDSQLSRLRSDKVSYNQLSNLSDSLERDVYAIVNRNKTSPTLYYILFIANAVVTVILIIFLAPRLGGMAMPQQPSTGTDYVQPPKVSYRSLMPTKVSSTPSIAITNENIVNQKKLLRDLKYKALKLATSESKTLKKQLMQDIDDNIVKDETELGDHYAKLKVIHDEESKEQSDNTPSFRVTKGKDERKQ